MRRISPGMQILAVVVIVTGASVKSLAQTDGSTSVAQGEVVLTKLANPLYPPLARQTRTVGDVELLLEVRDDGRVQSAVALKGHPLLKPAALDSAQHSQFECRKCSGGTVSYSIVYTFQLIGSEGCCTASEANANNKQQDQAVLPRVTQAENHVTVTDQPRFICDPSIDVQRVRSLRCLYLWRCGIR